MDQFYNNPTTRPNTRPESAFIAPAHAADVTQGAHGSPQTQMGNGNQGRLGGGKLPGTGFIVPDLKKK